jgi:hypothetical protein
MSRKGKLIVAEQSGHDIHLQDPELMFLDSRGAVREVGALSAV